MTLLFSAFMEVQYAIPSRMENLSMDRLGYDCMATYYACMLVGSLTAPVAIQKLGGRMTLPLGASAFGLFVVAQLGACTLFERRDGDRAVLVTVWLVTFMTGLGGGLVWPAQGHTLTHYAPARLLNWYASFFSLCFFASSFLGAALTSVVMEALAEDMAMMALCLLAGLGVLTLSGLPEPTPNTGAPCVLEAKAWYLCLLAVAEGLCLNALGSSVFPLLLWRPQANPLALQEELQIAILFSGLGHFAAGFSYAPVAHCFGRRMVLVVQSLVLIASASLCDHEFVRTGQGAGSALSTCSGAFLLGFGVILARIGNTTLVSANYAHCAGSAFAMMAAMRSAGSVFGFLVLPAFSDVAQAWMALISLALLAFASVAAALHAPLFKKERPRKPCKGDGKRLRIAFLTNKPTFLQSILPLAKRHDLLVVSPTDAVRDICLAVGIAWKPFPLCSDLMRFGRICAEDAEYRERVEAAYADLRSERPDIILTAGFYVLPKHAVEIAKIAALNFHPSALPRYRGVMPIQAMLLRGEEEMRCTLHIMTEVIDDPRAILAVSEPQRIGGAGTSELFDMAGGCLPRLVQEGLTKLARALEAEAAPAPELDPALPHAFGVRLTSCVDPTTGETKKSNSGVLARVRIEWEHDSAGDIERACRAFVGNSGLFTDYMGYTWEVTSCSLCTDVMAETAAAGTVLRVAEDADGQTNVTVAAKAGVVALRGRFVSTLLGHPPVTSPVSVEVGGRFVSTTTVKEWLKKPNTDWFPGSARFGS